MSIVLIIIRNRTYFPSILDLPSEPKTWGGIPRASNKACRRPTSGSSASGSIADGAELPKLTGIELAPAKLWAKLTFVKLSDSPLNATAVLAGSAEVYWIELKMITVLKKKLKIESCQFYLLWCRTITVRKWNRNASCLRSRWLALWHCKRWIKCWKETCSTQWSRRLFIAAGTRWTSQTMIMMMTCIPW